MPPSPSSGPPLLSASPSPPPFCGMLVLGFGFGAAGAAGCEDDEPLPDLDFGFGAAGAVACDGDVLGCAGAAIAPPPPQPAAANAASGITAAVARKVKGL